MQLMIRDVSKFFDVPDTTIMRWIKQRGMPAQRVNDQYRFNRTELLEWATANHLKVSAELFDHLDGDDEPTPDMAQALQAGGIFYQLQATNKEQALRALVQALPLPDGVDREFLLRLFMAREASASTAIGDGIALPHVRNPIVLNVTHPMISLCFLQDPIDFGALDGKPVQVLFSLICPTMRSHLQLLSRLSYALHDAKFKETVMRQAQPDTILLEAGRVAAGLAAAPMQGGKVSQ
jgi:PTS system nitrogen regulatory IIA component